MSTPTRSPAWIARLVGNSAEGTVPLVSVCGVLVPAPAKAAPVGWMIRSAKLPTPAALQPITVPSTGEVAFAPGSVRLASVETAPMLAEENETVSGLPTVTVAA